MKKHTAIFLSVVFLMSACFNGISTEAKAAETKAQSSDDTDSSDDEILEEFAEKAAKSKNAQKSTWTEKSEFNQYEIGNMSFVLPDEWELEDEESDGTLYFETDTAMLMVIYDEIDEDTMKFVDLTDEAWQDTFIEGMMEELDMSVISQEAKTYSNVKGFEMIAETDVEGYQFILDMIVVQDEVGLYEFLLYNFNDDATIYSEDLNNIVDTLGETTDSDSVGELNLEGITKNAKNMDTSDDKIAISSEKTKQYKTPGMYMVDVSEDWEPMENDDEEDPSIYFMNDNAMLQINFGQLSLTENSSIDLTDKETQEELMEAVCDVDELGMKKTETETVKLSGLDGFKFSGDANIEGMDIDFEAIILHNKSEGLYMFYIYNFSGESGLYEEELETIADSLTLLEKAQ